MGAEAVVVLVVLLIVFLFLALTSLPADAVCVGGLTLLLVFPVPGTWKPVLSIPDGLAGFGNEAMATVGVLFVVVAGLRATGAIDWLAHRVLGRPRGVRGALVRVILPVCGMSAFLNNTPVVAMLIPAVSDWAKRLRLSPSKLMLPLSYAAILGGTCSLIGTSTNLVVNGLMTAATDRPSLGMFDIAWIGVPCALVGFGFLVILGPRMLPDRGVSAPLADPREYTAEMIVPPGSALVGQTIEEGGLRSLPGAFLVEIERGEESIVAVGPDQLIHAGDRLVFAGVVESIRDLQNLRGLAPATDQVFKLDAPRHRRCLFEVVVSDSCPIVGQTIREGRFRTVYNAAVLAVARNGERLSGKIGDIQLRAGDMLLLEAKPSFETQQRHSRDFFLTRPIEDSTPRRHDRALIAIGILVAMVALATLGWLSMIQAGLLAAGMMIITRCCSTATARQSVEWPVLIVIGAALGFGKALDVSGAARAIADAVVGTAGSHPWLALAAVYLVTSILTEVITNNAAVALVFPIAMATSQQLGVDFQPFIMAIMMAGSASFATPLGYQTNLMVYGPGGYVFSDYLRIGIPMNLLMAVTSITLIPLIWKF